MCTPAIIFLKLQPFRGIVGIDGLTLDEYGRVSSLHILA